MKIKRKATLKYQNEQKFRFADMSENAIKSFWKNINNFRNKKSSATGSLTIGEIHEYFNRIMKNRDRGENLDFSNLPDINIEVQELDKPITEAEILKAINSLKRGKSPTERFFIDVKDFVIPYLVKIYYRIYDSGIYPESWCKGLIVPIYKKGDKSDPNNYRGIMLISAFAKLFSLVLRNHLNSWCEDNDKLSEFQIGFLDGRSTSDCILYCIHSSNVCLKKMQSCTARS